jgi:hypothetical protein
MDSPVIQGSDATPMQGNIAGLASLGSMFGPVGMAAGAAAGIGLSIFGGLKSYDAAKQQYGVTQQIQGLEMQAEAQRKQMMELNAKRMMTQNVRNTQRARSMALSTATGQGSQYGSATAGAYGQISGQSGVNLLGVSQQLGAGENLFGINKDIMGLRQQYTQLGSQSYTGQMMSNLGSTIGRTAPLIGRDLPYGF